MADVVQSFVDEPTQEELVLLEEVKRCVQPDQRQYLEERVVNGARRAAVLLDEYVLTHKGTFKLSSSKKGGQGVPRKGAVAPSIPKPDLDQKPNKACFYCKKDGHVMSACWKLKKKREKEGISNPKALTDAFAITRTEHLPSFERVAENYKPFISSEYVSLTPDKISRQSLDELQGKDPEIVRLAQSLVPENEEVNETVKFYKRDGILMRRWRPPDATSDEDFRDVHQVVLPKMYRKEIISLAHEAPLAGHLGINKTQEKVLRYFFWPGLRHDVAEFCRSCHVCQVVGKPNQKIPPAPLRPIPAFEEPFSRVIVDCVGPLPRTKSGNQYLLTMMCASTRFPEAIPLRTITAKNVSKALVKFFTMVGLPKCVQSDQGSNFTSKIFQQVMSELGVECKNSSAYHPQSQGALERFHQTLKNMMRVYCSEHEKEWDEGIPLLLFAVRESVQESLGFSPFELVFGHSVRGPLKILQEKILVEPESNLLDYVCQCKDRLSCTRELAAGHLKAAQSNMKRLFDRKVKEMHFEPGSKVLVLLPLQGDALKARYAGPYVVEKRDGSLRFCTDYRLLNSKTKSDWYPLPRIDDCIDRVGNAKYVSKFDLLKGYWQVPLSERAKELSAFVTPDGFFQYKVMPFGMKNAPATFQRLINTVTSGLVGCEAYLDDIVYSHTWEDHLRVRALFDRLTSANLTPVEAKVETILNFPRPQSKRELRRFLGMTGYYRKFCHNFADAATPLTNMLRKDSQFDWSDDCQVAFNRLKAMLASSPVLAAPNFDKQFILMVDASDTGGGGALVQMDDNGVDHPVTYMSRKFNKHQRRYSSVEKETLALVMALRHFDVYLNTTKYPVLVYTDHNPLVFLSRMRNKNGRLTRWALVLQEYNLVIPHVRGKDNVIADALSRG
ncbi:uncharacterized protein [Diadema setosum]|uniref:uncharacterized protein n=1 Tax=Diadema setosum TaxID=31175 RepID=UPI003B3AD37C